MKKLSTSDLFSALRLVKAADLKKELKPIIMLASKKGANIMDVGIEGVLTVLETFSQKKAEMQFYEFLSAPLEMTVEEIANMDINDFVDTLVSFAKENDMKRFFNSLGQLIKKS